MGGLAILFVVGLYLAIGLWIVIKSPGWWRLVALLVVVLIPTADALWGRYVTLPRLCKDAGLKVYAKASKEGGLMLSTADDYLLTKYGFPFVEGVDGANKVYRRSLREGKPVLELDVHPRAKYVRKAVQLKRGVAFEGTSYQIQERRTGQLISELSTYAYRGGWAERLLGSFTDSGAPYVGGCDLEEPESRVARLLATTFDLGE